MIQHVSLESRRQDAADLLRFWRALGFHEVVPPPTLAERTAWLQRGATQVHLLWTDEPVVPPRGHVGVVADDYQATLAALRDEGFEPEAHQQHWGAGRSFVHGPGGQRVEVMEAPPPGD